MNQWGKLKSQKPKYSARRNFSTTERRNLSTNEERIFSRRNDCPAGAISTSDRRSPIISLTKLFHERTTGRSHDTREEEKEKWKEKENREKRKRRREKEKEKDSEFPRTNDCLAGAISTTDRKGPTISLTKLFHERTTGRSHDTREEKREERRKKREKTRKRKRNHDNQPDEIFPRTNDQPKPR